MKKIITSGIIAIALAFVSLVSFSSSTYAQTVTKTEQEERCSLAQTNLSALITDVTATKTVHSDVYTGIKTKIDTIITTAKSAGYDTADLAAASTKIQTAMTQYEAKSTAYTTSLTTTKNLDCDESDTALTAGIVKNRADLVSVRTSTLAVRTVIKNDAITALKDYAAWLALKAGTSTEEGTEQ